MFASDDACSSMLFCMHLMIVVLRHIKAFATLCTSLLLHFHAGQQPGASAPGQYAGMPASLVGQAQFYSPLAAHMYQQQGGMVTGSAAAEAATGRAMHAPLQQAPLYSGHAGTSTAEGSDYLGRFSYSHTEKDVPLSQLPQEFVQGQLMPMLAAQGSAHAHGSAGSLGALAGAGECQMTCHGMMTCPTVCSEGCQPFCTAELAYPPCLHCAYAHRRATHGRPRSSKTAVRCAVPAVHRPHEAVRAGWGQGKWRGSARPSPYVGSLL